MRISFLLIIFGSFEYYVYIKSTQVFSSIFTVFTNIVILGKYTYNHVNLFTNFEHIFELRYL